MKSFYRHHNKTDMLQYEAHRKNKRTGEVVTDSGINGLFIAVANQAIEDLTSKSDMYRESAERFFTKVLPDLGIITKSTGEEIIKKVRVGK